MKVKVITDSSQKQENYSDKTTVEQVIKQKKLSRQAIVPLLNGKVVHPQTVLKNGDELKLVGVIYGG